LYEISVIGFSAKLGKEIGGSKGWKVRFRGINDTVETANAISEVM
jgi:hypothetical protein